MSNRSETFGRLLKGAINSIAAYEGKTAPAIEDELGDQIGVAGSTIQRYKAGYLPTEPRVVQILAEAAVRRGYLSRAWLLPFLQAARYPNSDALVAGFGDLLGSTAEQRSSALPSGMLAFLFTDIVGSTTRWEHQPQAMERALARHDELLRQAIDAYGGHVVKTVGDAFQAVFTTAPAALEAALAAQRALANESWGPIEHIQVRMAVHVGIVQIRDDDYFGQPLNRVARLCTAGHGGQVLLSNAAQELVRDSLPKGVVLRDLGEHRLKDLARSERIFQVTAPDLQSDFPSLRTLDRYTHNLPAQPTALIGRESAVLAVADLVRRDGVRLLTLTGPGGTGKTRLALQVAADLLDEFRDGVWFVALAPIRDHSLVLAAIAQALGVVEATGQSLEESLKAYLRSRQALLVLDNFEQVLDAGPQIAALLTAAPALKVLVTSREMLHLYGEHEYEVPPLSLPDINHLPPIERLTQYEAVRLFIERAQALRSDFAVTGENAPAIAEICIRLDGLPLAIELAAARSKLFPPKALLARLDKRLALLTGGPRDLPARQQTLRNAISWSYDLLDPAEQALFARLGVFVGGCTLESAEAVLADDRAGDAGDLTAYIPASAVLDGLASLVDKSLLKEVESVGDAARFMMLETIREYALERLEESGEVAAVRQRHAGYYLALAEAAHPQLRGAERRMWLERVEGEHNNLRAALTWALKGGDAEIGGRLAVVLAGSRWGGSLWSARDPSEGWRWLQAVLAQRSAVSPAIRARALLLTANSSWQPKDEQERAQACEEAMALFRAVGDRSGIAATLTEQGVSAVILGDYAQAVQHYEASLALYRELGDRHGIATTLHSLGDIVCDQGDTARAVALLHESLALCREQGFVVEAPLVLCALGAVPCTQGDYPRAIALYWEAVALFRHLGDRWNILAPLLNLGWLALVQGDDGRVRALLEEQVGWFREEATPIGLAHVLHVLGAVVNAQGEATQASALLREALILQQQFGRIDLIMESLERFAGLVAGQNQPIRAARLLGATEVLRTGAHMKRFGAEQAAYDHIIATVRAQLGEEAFAAAWAEGRALTLEQAIAEALAISG